ncbi:hypothetical protein pb186bvf_001233 [Paramecium bursaria]
MRTRAQSSNQTKTYESNFNNFQLLMDENQNDKSFLCCLRAPYQTSKTSTSKKSEPPTCFGVNIVAQKEKHSIKDIPQLSDIQKYEHLIRRRIGIKPTLGQVVFETSLRFYPSNQNTKSRDPSRISRALSSYQEKQQNSFTSVFTKKKDKSPVKEYPLENAKDPYNVITEKNMSIFQHCLKDNQGTVRQDTIQYLVSLKKYPKLIEKISKIQSRTQTYTVK